MSSQNDRRFRVTIGMRFVAALAASVILAVAASTASNLWISSRLTQDAVDQKLQILQEFLVGRIRDEASRAVSLADSVAGNAAVQDAFAARDREALLRMLLPAFKGLKERHAVVQMQFHTAPATSFLRVGRPEKFGDDLSGFRRTVVEVNATGRPVSGLENGVEGLGIRGVVPVFRDGKPIGSVETGISFGKPFLEAFRQASGAEVALYLKSKEGFTAEGSTFKEPPTLTPANLTAALERPVTLSMALGGVDHTVVLAPVRDYRGDTIGVSVLGIDSSVFTTALARARLWSLAIGLAVLVVALGFGALLDRSVVRPLRALTRGMHRLADGDLEVVVPGAGRADEIGEMADAVGVFKTNAIARRRLEAEQKETAGRMAAARSADMHRLADQFETAVGGIIRTVSSASTELEATAKSLTRTADTTQELSTEVSAASREASTNVQAVAAATDELTSSIAEISRQVQSSTRIGNEAVAQVSETDAHVTELSQAADRIGDVVKLISAIAGQTNLLALNATIEAARAGEAGKGFVVVAQEVKALASQTGRATGDIGAQIAAIQTATLDSVGAIKVIGGTIEEIAGIAAAIAAAVEQQGAATAEIARNIQLAAAGTSRVAERIDEVSHDAEDTGAASRQVLAAAAQLAGESSRLKLEVDSFLATIRAA